MSKKTWQKIFSVFLLAGMLLSLAQPNTTRAMPQTIPSINPQAQFAPEPDEKALAKIEPQVLDEINGTGSSSFIVRFLEQADLSAAYQMAWKERGEFVYNTLKETAARSQAKAIDYLQARGVEYQSYFTGNELFVKAGDLDVVTNLASLENVESIRAPRTYHIDPTDVTNPALDFTWVGELVATNTKPTVTDLANVVPQATTDWGIIDTNADDFWAAYGVQGEGIVVANIDTGVQWDHPALADSFKCGIDPTDPACWADPSNICGATGACDNNGHGTHTMGTMVANDDDALPYIAGMAPNAQWIACKGCESTSCSDTALNTCADWIVAPNGDPANRPNIVNNSWGGDGGDNWYLTKVNAWRAAGIFPAFSSGNPGSMCGAIGSPSDYQESFATANHMISRVISSSSGRGPSVFGDDPYTKPNISAPGTSICSTVPTNGWNCGYSGTSMASPHSAGAVALIWSCNPGLIGQIDQTFQILQDSADVPLAGNCGAPPDGEGNYTYGYGYLNVLAAGLANCGANGTLAGTVTDGTNPIEGATVQAELTLTQTYQAITNPDGYYSMSLLAGMYTVGASAFGYVPQEVTGVLVGGGITTTQDFALAPAASYILSVTVVDDNTDWPLYASTGIGGTPWEPVWNDPVTGHFEVLLPAGVTYTLGVDAWIPGYLHQDVVVDLTSDVDLVVELEADGAACVAPGYAIGGGASQNFDSATPPALPTGWAELIIMDPGTDPNWDTRAGTSHPSGYAAHSAPNLVYFNSWSSQTGGQARLYTLAGYDMTALPGAGLSFWMFRDDAYAASNDLIQVQVSTDGGTIWVNVGPEFSRYSAAGDYWEQKALDLSAYSAETNLMLGFLATSAFGNDIHLDDILVGAGCSAPSGGLVVGNVYDENTSLPLVGAVVSNDSAETFTAAATPADVNVDDAFYTLYSPAGVHSFTAAFTGYGPHVQDVTVISNETVEANFYLPSPSLVVDPALLSATLELGTTTTESITLTNDGGVALDFELVEKSGEYIPLNGVSAGLPVLVVRYDTIAADAMQAALTANGYTYLGVTDPVFQSMTVDDLLAYQAVFYAGVAYAASQPLLMAYLDAGGSLYISDNDFGYSQSATLFYQTYLQSTYVADNGGDLLIGDDLMAGLNPDITTDPYPDSFTVGAEGVQIFHFTPSGPSAGIAVDRNGYLAVYTSFDFQQIASAADEVELVNRVMGYLGVSDVTWLSESPITGTIPVDGDQLVDVTFDASVPEVPLPGTYTANLVVKSNDPVHNRFSVPVEMHVTAPADWGELQGVVNTLGYCDADPGPLSGATVFIEGGDGYTATAVTDASGFYHFWVDSDHNPLTVTVSAVDYIGESAVVNIVAGGVVIQPFDLRWLKPCVSVAPDTLEATVEMGISTTLTLTIQNTGAVATDFTLQEQDGGYNPGQGLSGESVYNRNARTAPSVDASRFAETGRAADKPVIGPASGGPVPEDIGDAWETMAPLPSGRVFNAVIADQNGYLYVMAGTSDAGGLVPTDTNYRYNTFANTWDTMAPIPASMSQIDGFAINNKIYIPGDAATDTTYVYEIAANTWSSIPTNGGYTARSQYQVVAIGDDLYVLGGIVTSLSTSTTEVWVLDTNTGTWTAGVPMQNSRTSFSAGSTAGVIYVAGGVYFPGFTPDMTAEMFDGTAWSYIAPVPSGGGAYTRWSYNADGMGADGLWLAAGRRDAGWAVLNHAGYYNPDTDTWTDSPTVPALLQGRVYVEGDVAIDGYFYVIGGRDSNGAIIYTTNERLLVGSPASGDVPWLSEAPVLGTVDPDTGEVIVDVTMDSAVVPEPGVYYAFLKVLTDDPVQGLINVPVTMTVSPTADFGSLFGTVTSQGYCDAAPAPIEGAEVIIEASDGTTYTVVTDANGDYSRWLPVSGNNYIVSVTAVGHEFDIEPDVVIIGQGQTQVDFALRLLEPCVSAAPAALEAFVPIGYDQTTVLDILNDGAVSADWSIKESGSGMLRLSLDDLVQDGSFEAGTPSPYWVEYSTNFGTPICDEAVCGTGGGTAGPNTGLFWSWFGGIAAYEEGWVSQDIVIPSGLATLSFYLWIGTDTSPAEDYFDVRIDGNVVFHATGADNPTYPSYTLVTVDISDYADGASHNVEFYSECQGSGTTNFNLDDIVLETAPGIDVPWLAEDPITGTVPHDSSFPVDVTFTAFPTMTVGDVFTASLSILSNDPVHGEIIVPVTMHVVEPAFGVSISPDDSLTGLPGETVVYAVTITNAGNGPLDTYTVTLGTSAWTSVLDVTEVGPLAAGESATAHVSVTVPADVVLPDNDAVQVTATSQGNPALSAIATLTTVAGGEFGVDLEPEVSAADGGPGDVITYTLRLTNTGITTDTIEVSVAGAGAAWATLPQDTFELAGGEAVDVLVVVTIPAGAAVGDYPITVTAASIHDPAQTDDVVITTTVVVTQFNIYLPLMWKVYP